MPSFIVRRAAVLGSGVMGRQIAAHLAGCGVPVILFDLPASTGATSGIAIKAIEDLVRSRPAPLLGREVAQWIEPANYDEHLGRLAECDLVIEAIAERLDWKRALYARVAPHISGRTVLVSNTSGLSITELAGSLPEALRTRFCGVHFFNPVRLMHLVELIPAACTDARLVDDLESFVVQRLGKGCVRAFDSPNFIANRVGTFAFVAAMHHTERLGLGFDEVDALTGTLIGRPGSATYRTLDLIGLDTIVHVLEGLPAVLKDDPWCQFFRAPPWMKGLIDRGALGQKTRGGIYRKEESGLTVLDGAGPTYRPSAGSADPSVTALLAQGLTAKALSELRAMEHLHAQFLWSVLRDLWHYCAVHLGDIAESAREVDLAMRWGYGWDRGPFEALAGGGVARGGGGDRHRHSQRQGDVECNVAGVGDGRPDRRAWIEGVVLAACRCHPAAQQPGGVRPPDQSAETAGGGHGDARRHGAGAFRQPAVAPGRCQGRLHSQSHE